MNKLENSPEILVEGFLAQEPRQQEANISFSRAKKAFYWYERSNWSKGLTWRWRRVFVCCCSGVSRRSKVVGGCIMIGWVLGKGTSWRVEEGFRRVTALLERVSLGAGTLFKAAASKREPLAKGMRSSN
ncbi:hypothetical protein DM01DRAFT_1192959 [Hesseltinella vesiculosa]|uniref:Uncharacterized protein n=1 Tax=Hesseltinella vesiculosa TaxID=101127 RepID=A0A1X2GRU9_9FUNG|nr:hypothetical protein DM01DRAFT_1192959 [Hesseltinella vesiculosa]